MITHYTRELAEFCAGLQGETLPTAIIEKLHQMKLWL